MQDDEQIETRELIQEAVNDDEIMEVSEDLLDGRDKIPSSPELQKEAMIEAVIEQIKPVKKKNIKQKQNRKSK